MLQYVKVYNFVSWLYTALFLREEGLRLLELCDGKLSCTVLRGERGREAPDLPGYPGLIVLVAYIMSNI